MSGTTGQVIVPVTYGWIPPPSIGPKTIPITIIWNVNPNNPQTLFVISLQQQIAHGQFGSLQAIKADNTTCPYPVTITSLETGDAFTVPAFTLGTYPILSGNNPLLTCTIPIVGAFTTKLQLMNLIAAPFQQSIPLLGEIQTQVTTGAQFTNASPLTALIYTHPYANRMSITGMTVTITVNSSTALFGGFLTFYETGSLLQLAVLDYLGNPPQIESYGVQYVYRPPWVSKLNSSSITVSCSAAPPAASQVTIGITVQVGNLIVS